jgi:allantoicase
VTDSTRLVDLAAERLGGRVLVANDEFFAPKENLLKATAPVFIEGKYTTRGKWMDGWETRRRRTPGYDWCLIRLGLAGIVRGILVDTSFFRGNYPEHCSIEACSLPTPGNPREERRRLQDQATRWNEILPRQALKGDSSNAFTISDSSRFTHLRLKIYPDGGVARLRAYGEVVPEPRYFAEEEIDLAAIRSGGQIIASSDQFFGEPLNLLMPGRGRNMADAWETKRRRGPGHDWVVIKLGAAGSIRRIEVDTAHFKGNFPDACSVEGACVDQDRSGDSEKPEPESIAWCEVLARTKLKADHRHVFAKELRNSGNVSHIRFNIYPDGGVSRLRIFGTAANWPVGSKLDWLNALPAGKARAAFLDCCGAHAWANRMAAARPFRDLRHVWETADDAANGLERRAWLEAFRHHPPIGGTKAAKSQSKAASEWSRTEQRGAAVASFEQHEALAKANRAYRRRFGYIFIVCASGKGAEEMLKILEARLANDPEKELRVAADEQRKITRLRLEKLLSA